MELIILGAGTPYPGEDRFGTAFLLDIGDEKLLFDCGPATTQKLAKAGVSPTMVTGLFFTHHHFDHNADYPCFVLARWDQGAGRIPDLRVWGPWPTLEFTDRLFGEYGAFRYDVEARVNHPASLNVHRLRGGQLPRTPPRITVQQLEPEMRVYGLGWSVETARVEHVQPYLESLAYRVETPDGSLVISGDTSPCDSLVKLARGADTLAMVCWGEQEKMEKTGETIGMTGTDAAGKLARDAGVGRIVLVHMGPTLSDASGKQRALEQVSRHFSGEIVVSEELMRLDVSAQLPPFDLSQEGGGTGSEAPLA